ncbi:hypothetical protein V7O66_12195 [Methanolobus sp. ZRKC3]|uniref:hypothetical protein n=1 Tax=Methanolobus sp. ZRKC3 TaxID=3125786 RepID=UPI003245EE6F
MSENVEFSQHKDFLEYFEKIGIGVILQEKIEEIYNFYQNVCSEKIEDIFIDEYINADGERVYEDINLFSESFVMVSNNFIKLPDFFMCSLKNNVAFWAMEKIEYDFIEANEKSRMNLRVSFNSDANASFKGSKENCDHLKKIMMKYIVTNCTQS